MFVAGFRKVNFKFVVPGNRKMGQVFCRSSIKFETNRHRFQVRKISSFSLKEYTTTIIANDPYWLITGGKVGFVTGVLFFAYFKFYEIQDETILKSPTEHGKDFVSAVTDATLMGFTWPVWCASGFGMMMYIVFFTPSADIQKIRWEKEAKKIETDREKFNADVTEIDSDQKK
jgi:hypothetical protein